MDGKINGEDLRDTQQRIVGTENNVTHLTSGVMLQLEDEKHEEGVRELSLGRSIRLLEVVGKRKYGMVGCVAVCHPHITRNLRPLHTASKFSGPAQGASLTKKQWQVSKWQSDAVPFLLMENLV
jgi:hypothetical protein